MPADPLPPSVARDWRSALAELGPPTAVGRADGATAAEREATRPLGLQFELRRRVQRRSGEWRGPRDEPARRAVAVDRLAVRPVTQGARGAWVKGGLTWQNIGFQASAAGVDPAQSRWFAQFAMLKGSPPSVHVYGSEWITVDDFESPLLWAMLDEAGRLGIALVGSDATPDVVVRGDAAITLDASVADDGALTLTPTLTLDADDRPLADVRPVAGHGVYRFDFDAGLIELAPLAGGSLTPAESALLAAPATIHVPAAELPDFAASHFHPLAGTLTVASRDGSFTPPPRPPATLVLDARFEPGDVLRLSWRWEHADGRTTEVDPSAAADDPELDDDLLARVDDELGWIPLDAVVLRGVDAAQFSAERMPRLEALAQRGPLRIDVRGERPDYREATARPEVRVTTVETNQPDWFDLGVVITVNGKTVPFMRLFRALAKGQKRLLLVDKSYLSLTQPVFAELRQLIEEAGDLAEWETGRLPIHRSRTSLWADFEDLADVAEPAIAWRATVAALEDGRVEELAPPDGLALPLRPYQLAGFRWLAYLWANRLGGVLADDMGLGKTVQCLALIRHACGGRVVLGEAGHVSRPPARAGLDTPSPSAPATRPTVGDLASGGRVVAGEAGHVSRPSAQEGLGTPSPSGPATRPTVGGPAPGGRVVAGEAGHVSRPFDEAGLGTPSPSDAATRPAGAPPFLVVAPTSVASNWVHEAARFTPDLRVALVTGTLATRRRALADIAAQTDIIVTTYAVLRLDADEFAALEWAGLILDEAQFVKNAATKVHDAARAIRAPFRLAVTGTPLENHLGELWAILRIVAPGLFPSRRAFDEQYRRSIEDDRNTERLERLRRRIRPLVLRRTKEAVAPELPPKQEQVLEVELAPEHRRLYDVVLQRERQKLLGLVEDLDRQRFIVYRSLTLLRMLALDATLIDPEQHAGIPSAKLDALFEQLDDVLAEGHRALVFSQFTSFLGRVAGRLDAAGVPYAYLDGSTPARRRDEEIARFRSGEASVFCLSLKAGGFGLNLTEADYVFLLDPWWNPASESQAIDRAHRIGQERHVMVYRLVAAGTIEEKVMALKARKGELAASVLDDDALAGAQLDADDLRELLER